MLPSQTEFKENSYEDGYEEGFSKGQSDGVQALEDTRKLRDKFAMAALTGLLRESIDITAKNGPELKQAYKMKRKLEVKTAYQYADEMLLAREGE